MMRNDKHRLAHAMRGSALRFKLEFMEKETLLTEKGYSDNM